VRRGRRHVIASARFQHDNGPRKLQIGRQAHISNSNKSLKNAQGYDATF
jgi:hypothetical protein